MGWRLITPILWIHRFESLSTNENDLSQWQRDAGTQKRVGVRTGAASGTRHSATGRHGSVGTCYRRGGRQRQRRVLLGATRAHVRIENHGRPQVQRCHRSHVQFCDTDMERAYREAPPEQPQSHSSEKKKNRPEHTNGQLKSNVVACTMAPPTSPICRCLLPSTPHQHDTQLLPAPPLATVPGSFRCRYCMTRRRLATKLTRERRVTWSFACVRKWAVR